MKLSYLISLLSFLALCASCSTHKQAQKNIAITTDSTQRSDKHRTFLLADSVVQQLNLSFDTLEITIERPRLDTVAIAPEIPCQRGQKTSLFGLCRVQPELDARQVVKLRAVKGTLTNDRQHHRNIIDTHRQLDTVAYHQATADKSMEHTATTRIYQPPSGTIIILVSLLLVATFVFIRFRK